MSEVDILLLFSCFLVGAFPVMKCFLICAAQPTYPITPQPYLKPYGCAADPVAILECSANGLLVRILMILYELIPFWEALEAHF